MVSSPGRRWRKPRKIYCSGDDLRKTRLKFVSLCVCILTMSISLFHETEIEFAFVGLLVTAAFPPETNRGELGPSGSVRATPPLYTRGSCKPRRHCTSSRHHLLQQHEGGGVCLGAGGDCCGGGGGGNSGGKGLSSFYGLSSPVHCTRPLHNLAVARQNKHVRGVLRPCA